MTCIHVVTVHWMDDRWIEPQLRYLERFLGEHKVWAALNGVDFDRHAGRFHHADDYEAPHPVKLNRLAELARAEAGPDDLFLFLDGDAFPIATVDRDLLGGYPLAAMRRDENMGEPQPHPAFCLVPVDFWFAIEGDWRQGYSWIASNGVETTDGGGNLLGILRERDIEWRPLVRSNRFDLDPLWFGVYGDVVYHHGAGFRPPVSMLAGLAGKKSVRDAVAAAVIPESVPLLGRLERSVRYRLARRRAGAAIDEYADRSQTLSDEVFSWIEQEHDFVRRFTDPDAYAAERGGVR
jgi:hypothetical protein